MTANTSAPATEGDIALFVLSRAAAPAALPVLEAAAYLGISKSMLDTWRSRGAGPRYVRLGTKVVYRIAALDDYLLANEHGARDDDSR
jgi:predicted DNA-binding transcriptional regulator AlpA